MKADDEIKREHAVFQEAFASQKLNDETLVLNCVNADPNANATLSFWRETDQYWESADFEKQAGGIRRKYEHSDAGGSERLYYLELGRWKFKPIRNWGIFSPVNIGCCALSSGTNRIGTGVRDERGSLHHGVFV
jgi:hypothetical protein